MSLFPRTWKKSHPRSWITTKGFTPKAASHSTICHNSYVLCRHLHGITDGLHLNISAHTQREMPGQQKREVVLWLVKGNLPDRPAATVDKTRLLTSWPVKSKPKKERGMPHRGQIGLTFLHSRPSIVPLPLVDTWAPMAPLYWEAMLICPKDATHTNWCFDLVWLKN